MLDKLNLHNILFLDIETVPEFKTWEEASGETQELFAAKTKYQRKEEFTAEEFYHRAGIWAEFGKIICISVAYFVEKDSVLQLRVTSFANDDEAMLLNAFKKLLDEHFNQSKHVLCAHNGKELI